MMKFKIVSNGTSFQNKEGISLLYDADFFNSEFSLDSTSNVSGIGEFLNRITTKAKTLNFRIWFEDISMIESLQTALSVDRSNHNPTRIYINDGYVDCYITKWSNIDPGLLKNKVIVKLEATALMPFWIKETKYEFIKIDETESIEVDGGLSFPFSFPFSFKQSRNNRTIVNSNPSNSFAEFIFYGPLRNIDIVIGDNRYQVDVELLSYERLVINQREKRIEKITSSGDRINMFNYRNKEHSVFAPIKTGEHLVSFNGEYSFEVVLFDERSEPSWI